MIAKIIYHKYQFKSIFSIQINVFDDDIHYVKKCLIKSFDGSVLFEIFKNNKFSRYVLICAMTIEIIIFIFFIVINAKTTNFKIIFLIVSLITFEDKKNLIFLFNDFHFRAFILIIKKNNEIFVIIMITRYYEIINIEMNQIQRSFFRANMSFIKCLMCLLDNV